MTRIVPFFHACLILAEVARKLDMTIYYFSD
jgi:hypothetical protein